MPATRSRPRPHRSTSAIYAYAETLRQEMLAEYQTVLEAQLEAAGAATNGVMLNKRGRARGLTEMDIFTANNVIFQAYASEELREYLAAHPRTTRTSFEEQWLDRLQGGDQ